MYEIDKSLLVKDSELNLPLGYELSIEEKQLILEKNIKLKFKDEQGKMFVLSENIEGKLKPIHALKAKSNASEFDENAFDAFPKVKNLTAFNAKEQIFKGDIQIKFRAELDESLALVLWTQKTIENETAKIWLNAIYAILRNIMSASCRHTVMQPFEIAGLSADAIHAYSHKPLEHLGYDHIIPSVELCEDALKVNMLRTKLRSMEVTACSIYFESPISENCTRPDLLYTLNRLSSAVYVLMHIIEKEHREKSKQQVEYKYTI